MASKLLPKPKAPDTSAQQKSLADQEARIKQSEEETKKRDLAAQNARRGRNASRASLITGGNEVGVITGRTKLG